MPVMETVSWEIRNEEEFAAIRYYIIYYIIYIINNPANWTKDLLK